MAAPTRKRSIAMYGGLMASSFVLVGVTAPNPPQQVSVADRAPTTPLISSQTPKPSVISAAPTPQPETVKTLLPARKAAISAAAPALVKPEIDRKLPSSVKSVERTAEIALDAQQPKKDIKKVNYESSKPKVKSADFPSYVNSDCNCSDFATQAQAQRVLEAYPGDPFKLDRDKDSIACETLG
ncbi:excalibur calcium-binding domain-containing protein [Lyngbya sp. CCAP 1446/10]|uniref:excalibur calcium-binding domain-containing protein n=1 Tax=Lyngbya sp. CCAP 1446/10 TaxID=439293 RepID=UPI0022390C99|nr:excalibur calcium-binding domain-containing protein [Lyngbya sp. CCAP 1446/10]MCW6053409.1 excalibur calcium-binding domain-containing protein [Lyngbya sp. CCAP 1446/10]